MTTKAGQYDATLIITTPLTLLEAKKKCAEFNKLLKKRGVVSVKKHAASTAMKNRAEGFRHKDKLNIIELDIKTDKVPDFSKMQEVTNYRFHRYFLSALNKTNTPKNMSYKQTQTQAATYLMEDNELVSHKHCSQDLREGFLMGLSECVGLGWSFVLQYIGDNGAYSYTVNN